MAPLFDPAVSPQEHIESSSSRRVTSPLPYGIIDADLHLTYRSKGDLLPYLAEPWRSQVAGGRGFGAGYNYISPIGVNREDSRPPCGGKPGCDPEFTRSHFLRPSGIEKCVASPLGILSVSCVPDPQFAAAVCSAYNDWLLHSEWMNQGNEYYGAMIVATQNAETAAQEIERVGDHPRICAIVITSASSTPYGQRRFWPLYEAAERKGLPIAVHLGAESTGIMGPPTAVGYPSSYFEWHTDLSQGYMAHVVSLVAEGVFQQFPGLKFVFTEGGFAWMPHLMWRMDKNYRSLRQQVPWLNEMPSEIIRRHIRMTTQPMEEPDNPAHLVSILDMLGDDRMLLFASDYPHWDFDDPFLALRQVPAERARRILRENALETFRFPQEAIRAEE